MSFEIFEHTADLGLRIRAETLETLFEEAGRALCSLIVRNPEDVRAERRYDFDLGGEDVEYLLFDWLNELLYHGETEHVLFRRFEVHRKPGGIRAAAFGEPIDRTRHRMDHEVKAITYHDFRVVDRGAELEVSGEPRWLAEIIVDI